MATEPIFVRKENGSQEPFSFERFSASLQKGGISAEELAGKREQIEARLYPGIPTREIYRMARSLLKASPGGNPAIFSLKKALLELGPNGFHFENLVGRLLEWKGYRVDIGQTLEGRCVRHEIDFLAERDGETLVGECKFRNLAGMQVDVKVPLYIRSRFEDIQEHPRLKPGQNRLSRWIVTNSRFSDDARQYAQCQGMHLLGWDFPAGDGLRDWIDASRLYPITVLQSLTHKEKTACLEAGFLVVQDVAGEKAAALPLSRVRQAAVEKECRGLLG